MTKTLTRLVVPFSVKADAIDQSARTFEGLAAVWDLDLGNDVIRKGAFKDTLVEWKNSGEAMPLLNSHNHWDIMAALGQMLSAKETTDGLLTKWEVIEGPDGDAVMTRLRPSARTGRALIGKMSIGYEPVEFSFEQPEGTTSPWDRIRHLIKVNLKEVSLVLFPMAPGASIDSSTVKTFSQMAYETDPTKVDVSTKQELRRLASRIGVLLKVRPTDANADDEEEEHSAVKTTTTNPPSPTPPTPTPAPTPAPAPSPTPAPTPTPTPAAASKSSTDDDDAPADDLDEPKEEKEQKSEPAVYQFSEALQQRLQATMLKNKIADIKQSAGK